jgi:nucleotide-binding universal stress UspA family protein
MKNILVPCDFSKPAINAFRMALDIAAQSGGIVNLVHVIQLPVTYDSVMWPALYFEDEALNDLKLNTEKEFSKLIKYNKGGVQTTSTVESGNLLSCLLEKINTLNIDLVLMGSHGAEGFKELMIGSNTEKLVRRSPTPVLIVKEYYKGPVKSIVFPNTLNTDFQEGLVEKVKALQNFFRAHLHIVWINTPFNFQVDTVTQKRLVNFASAYDLCDFSLHIFNHINEEEGILEFSKMIGADMIAMATHGKKGISHLLTGSLTEDVANHADTLIWTSVLQNQIVHA